MTIEAKNVLVSALDFLEISHESVINSIKLTDFIAFIERNQSSTTSESICRKIVDLMKTNDKQGLREYITYLVNSFKKSLSFLASSLNID